MARSLITTTPMVSIHSWHAAVAAEDQHTPQEVRPALVTFGLDCTHITPTDATLLRFGKWALIWSARFAVHRRKLFAAIVSTVNSLCPLHKVYARMATTTTKCCLTAGCKALPGDCSFECANVFPTFFSQCKTILKSIIHPSQFTSMAALEKTCASGMPVQPMLDAIAVAHCR